MIINTRVIIILLLCISAFIAGFVVSKTFLKTTTTTEYIKGKSDTTFIHDTTKIYITIPAKLDTITLLKDSVKVISSIVASVDTTIKKDSNSVNLHIKYNFPPSNTFVVSADFNITSTLVSRVDTVVINNTIVPHRSFFNRFNVGPSISAIYIQEQNKIMIVPGISLIYEIF